ncbi:MAG: glycosyltransferase [Dehalococcoidaceae bacterium]|nr:glycosyltransferase [Dehalococcoidaceae bacterium]
MSVYIREVAVQLAGMGYHVDIFTRKHEPHGGGIIPLAGGARLIHLDAGEQCETTEKISLYPHIDTFIQEIQKFARRQKEQYGLVFSHYWLSGVAGGQLARDWGVGHMVMFHTLAAVKNNLRVGNPEPQLRLKGEKAVVHSCQKIITATQRERQSISLLYDAPPEKISVVTCGVNMSLFKPRLDGQLRKELAVDDRRIILYVGRIEPLKGPHLLLEALALLKHRQDWCCLIVGGDQSSNEEIGHLKEQAIRSGIGERLVFAGLVSQEKLPAYYSAADLLAVPSFYESFGLVALEALACGCPVVASDVGDLKNIITPGMSGDIVEKLTGADLAAKIVNWINRPARTVEETGAIRKTVERFGWDNVAGELAKEIDSLCPQAARAV